MPLPHSAAQTHERIESLFGEMKASHEANKLYEMVKMLLQNKEKAARPKVKIEEEIQQHEQQLKNIKDDFADCNIDLDTFNRRQARYAGEVTRLKWS